MTPLEAALLCRFTKAVCPQQAIDEYTPDAWHLLLENIRFEDAKAGVVAAAQKSPFVAPAEIIAEVRRIRSERLTEFGALPEPPRGLDDLAEQAWLRDLRRRIADGEHVERPELPPGVEKPDDIDFETVFRSVDDVVDAELDDDQESA